MAEFWTILKMKEDAIEKPSHPMSGAVTKALVWQVAWTVLYAMAIPPCSPCDDVMIESFVVAAAVFWILVVYIVIVRGRKVMEGDLLVIRFGVPVFSLVSLFIWSVLFAMRFGEWPL